jgi:hypothetical protein
MTTLSSIVPGAVTNLAGDTTPQLGGPLDANGNIIQTAQGSDVASANDMTLGSDGNFFDITGTTTINTIAAKGLGTFVVLQFDGVLQLTHSADLFLPTAGNITTAAGDIAVFWEYATGDWRCVSYTRADGSALYAAASGLSNVVEDTTPQLGGDLDLNGNNIYLTPYVGGADLTSSATLATLTAGENLVFGEICYFKSDGKLWKSDADATTTMPVRAMSLATISGDAVGVFAKRGYVRNDAWNLTVGGDVYASAATTGGISQTAPSGSGDQVQIIAYAHSADVVYFSPNYGMLEI